MIKLLFFYFNILVIVLFYDKIKANFQNIAEDIIKVLVLPLKVISWSIWKIRLLLMRH